MNILPKNSLPGQEGWPRLERKNSPPGQEGWPKAELVGVMGWWFKKIFLFFFISGRKYH